MTTTMRSIGSRRRKPAARLDKLHPRLALTFLVAALFLHAIPLAGLCRADELDDELAVEKDVYEKLVLSTALIWHVEEQEDDRLSISSGTGWIVDERNGYLITNEHVVHGQKEVRVSFPRIRGGKVIREAKHYLRKAPFSKGTVVATDDVRDLAVVKVGALPSYMRALFISNVWTEAGDEIYTIGNKLDIDEVFIPRKGKVLFDGFSVEEVDGRPLIGNLLYTSSAFVQGNSGGPIVKYRDGSMSLVGVVAAINPSKELNVNVGRIELESWLGTPYTNDNRNRRSDGDELDGDWVLTIEERLKKKDELGKLVQPSNRSLPAWTGRKRMVGGSASYDAFNSTATQRGYLTLRGHGREEKYVFRLLGDEHIRDSSRGFYEATLDAFTRKKGNIALYPYKNWHDYDKDREKAADAATLKAEEMAATKDVERKDDGAASKSPRVGAGEAAGFEFDLSTFGLPSPGADIDKFFDDPFGQKEPESALKPLGFDGDPVPPLIFGTRNDAPSALLGGPFKPDPEDFASSPLNVGQPFQVLYVTSNDPTTDWWVAKWSLAPYHFKGDIAEKLNMRLVKIDDERPIPPAGPPPR